MLKLLTDMIGEQKQVVAKFREDRAIWINRDKGIKDENTLTIDFAEAVVIYELQGMERVLARYNDQLKAEGKK